MAEDYVSYVLTNAGREMMARIIAGTVVTFKRLAIGDGYEYNMNNFLTKTELVSERLSINDVSMTIVNSDIISIEGEFSTSQLQTSFWYREIGVFIVDPDDEEKEILFAYGNRNDRAEYLTPHIDNYQILKGIECKISVGESQNVRIYINENETLNLYDFSAEDWVFNSALGVYVLDSGQVGVGVNVYKKTEQGNIIVQYVDFVINSEGVLTLQALNSFDGYFTFA